MNRTGLLGAIVVALDLVAVTIGLYSAHALWIWYRPHLETILEVTWLELWPSNPFMPPGFVLMVVWVLALRQFGLYDPARMTSSPRVAASVSRAMLLVPLVALVLQFILPDRTYSRFLILSYCGFTSLYVLVFRLTFFRLQRHIPRPITQQRVAIVGVGEAAQLMAQHIERFGHHAFHMAGFIWPDASATGAPKVPLERVLGSVADFTDIVNRTDIQQIVLASRNLTRDEALTLASLADQMGLRVMQAPFNWGVVASPRVNTTTMGDLQLIDLTSLTYPTLGEQVKRAVDLALAGTGFLFLLPFLFCVGVAVKAQDRGPALFAQPRAGRGGRRFNLLKFRSMVVDAEAQRAALAALNEQDGVLFKIKDDPRITPLGRFIRKYSIDELPQIWNVIRGDMNLVGPRPLPLSDLEGIDADPELKYWFEMRSKVKPGITGPWQVSGRSDSGFQEMVQHDVEYIQHWSIWLDLVILMKTIPAVLAGRGAA